MRTLREPRKKKEKYRTTREAEDEQGEGEGGGERIKKENEDERRRGEKKTKKTSTMQLWAHGERTSGRRVPGVFYWLVSVGWKFRIMYKMFAWTLLTLYPLGGYRKPLLVGPSIRKTTTGELHARTRSVKFRLFSL